METDTSYTSPLLLAALSSSVFIVVLLICALYFIHKRGCREPSIKTSLTAVINLPPAPLLDDVPDLREISSGYSGSGSGVPALFFFSSVKTWSVTCAVLVYRYFDFRKYDSIRAWICGLGRLDFSYLRTSLPSFFIKRAFIRVVMWFGVWLNYFQCQMSPVVCVPTWTCILIALILLPFMCYVVLCTGTSRWFDCWLLLLQTFKSIESNVTLILVDKPQPSYNLLNVTK